MIHDIFTIKEEIRIRPISFSICEFETLRIIAYNEDTTKERKQEMNTNTKEQELSSLKEQYELRSAREDDIEEIVNLENLCFAPHVACTYEMLSARIKQIPDMFLVASSRQTGEIAGFVTGLATEEEHFRDAFFEKPSLHFGKGHHVMILGLNVHPDYRHQGLAKGLMSFYRLSQAKQGKTKIILTCLEDKIRMYEKMGYKNLGLSHSLWGGIPWYEMVLDLKKSKDTDKGS